MGRIGLCVFCLLKFSVAMCILLVKKLEKGNITTKSGSLRNSMQKCGKILRGRAPPSFRRLCCCIYATDVMWPEDEHLMNEIKHNNITSPCLASSLKSVQEKRLCQSNILLTG